MEADNEWELSKENIHPLRSGRRMKDLKEAMTEDSVVFRNAIQDFETQLRCTEGEEQLDSWYSYISWMEQHYAKNWQEALELMKRCVAHYKNKPEFNQNGKLVHIWIKLSERMDDPNEIFKYLFDQDIGTSLAIFYKSWAEHLELIGSFKKADELYNLGINRNAEPVGILRQSKIDFNHRMCKRTETGDNSQPEQQSTRKVLGALKVSKHGKIGNDRVKLKSNSSSKLNAGSSHSKLNKHSGFAIYGDENPTPALPVGAGTGQIKQLPVDPAIQTENRKKMEMLKGARVKGVGGVSSVSQKFDIYSEEEAMPQNPTPKQVVLSARKPLSTRKSERDPYRFYDPNEKFDPNVVLKYCKHVIYMGSKEISFEELKSELPKYSNTQSRKGVRSKLTFANEPIKNQADEEPALFEEMCPTTLTDNDVNDEFFDTDIKSAAPSDVTLILKTMGENTFGLPKYESTKILNKIMMPPVTDVHMKTPNTKSSHQNTDIPMPSPVTGKTDFMLSELDQTRTIKLNNMGNNIEKMEFGSPIQKLKPSTQNYLDELDKTRQICVDNVGSSISQGIVNKVEADELEQLKQLSALSGVTLDIFGEKKLMLQNKGQSKTAMTPFTDNATYPDNAMPDVQNESLIAQLKALNASEDFETNSKHLSEMCFQQSVLSKTPTMTYKGENLCAPSPTVYTRNAMSNVKAMFSESFDQEKGNISFDGMPKLNFDMYFDDGGAGCAQGTEITDNFGKQQNGKQFSIFSDAPGISKSTKPFQIYSEIVEEIPQDKNKNKKPTKPAFDIFTDKKDVLEQSNDYHMKTGPTILDDEKTSYIGMPTRPVSTPASSDWSCVTFGQNLSEITTGIKFMKPDISELQSQSSINLSTIQERSNEDVEAERKDVSEKLELCVDIYSSPLKTHLLSGVEPQIKSSQNFLLVSGPLPKLQGASTELHLGPRHIRINKCLLKGGLSATYKAVNHENQSVALIVRKVVDNTSSDDFEILWDFYITNEIYNRLSAELNQDYKNSFVHHNMLYKYSDCLCVETQFYSEGTLKDLIELHQKHNCAIEEPLVMLYTFEILRIIHTMHSINIIHGRISPENFLQANCDLTEAGPLAMRCLKLKDFGSSIDLSLMPDPNNVMFSGSNNSDSFECEEMRTGRPWKYQVDLYAVAATIHVLIFQNFMNTYVEPKTKLLRICNPMKSGWNTELWSSIFLHLINPSLSTNVSFTLLSELAKHLNTTENISKLEEAIMKKDDLLMMNDE